MKIRTVVSLVVVGSVFLLGSIAVAGDCPGGWQKIANYNKSRMGAPCAYLGLDTHRGTCQPGQQYETLCDDASNGRYKTCRGPRLCYGAQQPVPTIPQQSAPPCSSWDYTYNQPCPPGFINRDCRGGCER